MWCKYFFAINGTYVVHIMGCSLRTHRSDSSAPLIFQRRLFSTCLECRNKLIICQQWRAAELQDVFLKRIWNYFSLPKSLSIRLVKVVTLLELTSDLHRSSRSLIGSLIKSTNVRFTENWEKCKCLVLSSSGDTDA